MKLESIEPSDGTLPSLCNQGKHFMAMYAPVMAYFDMCRIDKVDAMGLSQASVFQKQHHGYRYSLLQFYKTVIGYKSRKIISVIRTDVTNVKVLEIGEMSGMKSYQNSDDLTISKLGLTVSGFTISRIKLMLDDLKFKFFTEIST